MLTRRAFLQFSAWSAAAALVPASILAGAPPLEYRTAVVGRYGEHRMFRRVQAS